MADTTFVDKTGSIDADWLNDVNEITYNGVQITDPVGSVNYLGVTNSIAGGDVTVQPTGDDNNIQLIIKSKGTGNINISSTAGAYTSQCLGTYTLKSTAGAIDIDAITNISIDSSTGSIALTAADGVYGGINTHSSSPFATTSGTSIPVTGIPSWAKRVTITLRGVIFSATGNVLSLELGDASGIETLGYNNVVGSITGTNTCVATASDQFIYLNNLVTQTSTTDYHGRVVIELEDAANFNYAYTGIINSYSGGADAIFTSGSISLDSALTQFTLTAQAGAFTAGSFGVTYEG